MYTCSKCFQEFDEPDKVTDYVDDLKTLNYSASPCCKADFVENIECDCCRLPIADDYIEVYNGKKYCNDCCIERNLFE